MSTAPQTVCQRCRGKLICGGADAGPDSLWTTIPDMLKAPTGRESRTGPLAFFARRKPENLSGRFRRSYSSIAKMLFVRRPQLFV